MKYPSSKGWCIYQENSSDECDIPGGIPREKTADNYYYTM